MVVLGGVNHKNEEPPTPWAVLVKKKLFCLGYPTTINVATGLYLQQQFSPAEPQLRYRVFRKYIVFF